MDAVSLSIIDWVAVGLYFAGIVGLAIKAKVAHRNSEDFFLADRSMHWGIVLLSIFATLFSTVSFVAVPGEAYQHGLMLSLLLVSSIFFYPLAIWLFLRFFFRTHTFTAYEYLEQRYNLTTRLMGSAVYCLVRLLYLGTVFYAGAMVFKSLVGWPPIITILVIGIVTITYAVAGGSRAIMFSDALQGVVIVIGIAVIMCKILKLADFDLFAIYSHAAGNGKGYGDLVKPEFYRFNLTDRFSIWLLLINAVLAPLASLSADQSVVQRLLSSKSYKEAKKSIIGNALICVPIIGMLWIIGIGLFYYYSKSSSILPKEVTSDNVMGYFINTQLPSPLPGIITAALLAALMSTVASTVNCIANVVHRDWAVRLDIVQLDSKNELTVCRILSACIGMLSIIIAVLMTIGSENITSSVLEISGIWSSLWGILLVAFLFGVLVPRVSATAIIAGLLVGGAVSMYLPYALYYSVPVDKRIGFMWIGMPGLLIAALLPLIICIFRPNRKNLTDLTLWTLSKDVKINERDLVDIKAISNFD